MKPGKIFLSLALVAAGACGVAHAANVAPLPLHAGSNTFKLGKSGETVIAMLGRRENFNAHSFDVLTLYIKPAPAQGDDTDWQFVSIFEHGKEALTLSSSGGADCLLHDFRLLKDPAHGGLSLVVAERELGASYADDAPVTFKFYQFKRNTEGDVGMPMFYFELTDSRQAKKPYCDVGTAFAKELNIGPYRAK